MARKTLSSQVLAEVDRIRMLLGPLVDITDPMTGAFVNQALVDLGRIESLCLGAMQQAMNAVSSDTTGMQEVVEEENPPRRRTGAHKAAAAPRTRKATAK